MRPFEPECYVVRGTDSHGSPWMTRKFVCLGQYRSIEDAKLSAHHDVKRMNALGASVEAVYQVLSADGMLWADAPCAGESRSPEQPETAGGE